MVEDKQIIDNNNVNTILTFNAKSVQPEILERLLVGRKELVDILFKKIQGIILDKNNVQVQLIGKRGMGKSHITAVLFNRLKEYRINNSIKIAYLSEEEYGVASYLDFLIRIIHAFMRWYPETKENLELNFDTLRQIHSNNQEKFAENIILEFIQNTPLLILVENLDDIFDAIKINGQSKLRAFLYSNPKVNILATSQALSQDMCKEDKPFFGFFETIYLKNLEFDDSLALLRELAFIERQTEVTEFLNGKGIGYVKAIQQLVKGNHRLLVRFYEFLKVDTMASLSTMFMKTVNELKPYFESFIRPLPPLEQKIIYYLAFQRIPKRGSDIAKDSFIDTTSLSKKLSELQRRNLIDVIPDHKSKRDKLYEISDPMLRIAIASGENKDGFSGMVIDWIALWYNTAELKTQLIKYKDNILESEIRKLALSRKAEILHIYYGKHELYQEIADCIHLGNIIEAESILKNIPNEKKEENFYFAKGMLNKKLEKYNEAIQDFEYILNNINQKEDFVIFNLGLVYNEIGQIEKAIDCINKAIKYSNELNHDYYEILGHIYFGNEQYKKAIKSYKKTIEINPYNIEAFNSIALCYNEIKEFDESIKILELALNIDEANLDFHKGLIINYLDIENYNLAFKYLIKSLTILVKQKNVVKLKEFEDAYLVGLIIALIKNKKTTKDEIVSILNKLHNFNIENPDYSFNIDILEVYYRVKFLNDPSALLNVSKELREFIKNEIEM